MVWQAHALIKPGAGPAKKTDIKKTPQQKKVITPTAADELEKSIEKSTTAHSRTKL